MTQGYKFGNFASSDLVGIPESVARGLTEIMAGQTPLLNAVSPGLNNLSAPCTNVAYTYFEKQMRVKRTTLNGSLDNSTTTVVLTHAIAAAGEHIQVDEEVILLGTTSDNLTFSTCNRAQQNTSAAAHVTLEVVNLMGADVAQGSAAGTAGMIVQPNSVTAYTKIFREDIGVTGTAQALDEYWRRSGLSKYDANLAEQLLNQLRVLENNLFWSYAQAPSGVATAGRFSGIYQRCASYLTDLADVAFAPSHLDSAIQTVLDMAGSPVGGVADILLVNLYTAGTISKWGLPYMQLTPEQTAIYGERTRSLFINGVSMMVMPMSHLGPHCALLSSNFIKVGPLVGREFKHTFLGVDGDRVKGQIIGEYVAEIACPAAHRVWTSVKKSA